MATEGTDIPKVNFGRDTEIPSEGAFRNRGYYIPPGCFRNIRRIPNF
jgi:hypothetical protein